MRARSEDLTPELPKCVAIASAAAEELFTVVMNATFPQLQIELQDLPVAIGYVVDALQWAHTIHSAHRGVVKLFPPHEDGIEVEIPLPPSRLLGGHPTLLGGGFMPGYVPPPPRGAHGEIVFRPPRIDVASDVLEPVPLRFSRSIASAFPFCPGHVDGPFDHLHVAKWVTKEVSQSWERDGWAAMRSRLLEARMIMRAKSLGLVAWVRSCVAEMRSATLPEIVWSGEKKYGGQVVIVTLAGASRRVNLTKGEYDFLRFLAKGASDASRTTKADVIRKIPELDVYLESAGAASPKSSRYLVPAAVASRIHLQAQLRKIPTVLPTAADHSNSR